MLSGLEPQIGAVGTGTVLLLRTRFSTPLTAIEESLADGGVWEGQLVHTRRDGQEIIVDSRWALDAAGSGGIVLEINRDVTAHLAAEASARRRERQLRFVADSAPVLIAHCDLDHRFKFVNRPYAARFGLEPADLIGRRIPDVLGHEAYDTIKPYLTVSGVCREQTSPHRRRQSRCGRKPAALAGALRARGADHRKWPGCVEGCGGVQA